jgi:hypothetical protein
MNRGRAIVAHGWLCGGRDDEIAAMINALSWKPVLSVQDVKDFRTSMMLDPLPDKNRKTEKIPTDRHIETAKQAASVLTPNERIAIARGCSRLAR